MKCLIIDDDFDSRHLLQKILEPFASVSIATDGEEGVEAFHRALKEGEPYHIITMDLMMPNFNGQDALREIREIEKELQLPPEKQVKVIIISGLDDNKETHDAFFLGGATSYIIKPIRRQMLLDELASLGLELGEQKTPPQG